MAREKFTPFYGGVFSQWYHSPFVVDGVRYSCAEQYMMAQKARLFGDPMRLSQIMSTDDPAEQKALGKKVARFRKNVWMAVARDVVTRASLAKFTSTRELYGALMATRGTALVEASPTDVIWGVGLNEWDPDVHDRDRWRGNNWLGQVLTDLREQLDRVDWYVTLGFTGDGGDEPHVTLPRSPRSLEAMHQRDLEEDARRHGGHP